MKKKHLLGDSINTYPFAELISNVWTVHNDTIGNLTVCQKNNDNGSKPFCRNYSQGSVPDGAGNGCKFSYNDSQGNPAPPASCTNMQIGGRGPWHGELSATRGYLCDSQETTDTNNHYVLTYNPANDQLSCNIIARSTLWSYSQTYPFDVVDQNDPMAKPDINEPNQSTAFDLGLTAFKEYFRTMKSLPDPTTGSTNITYFYNNLDRIGDISLGLKGAKPLFIPSNHVDGWAGIGDINPSTVIKGVPWFFNTTDNGSYISNIGTGRQSLGGGRVFTFCPAGLDGAGNWKDAVSFYGNLSSGGEGTFDTNPDPNHYFGSDKFFTKLQPNNTYKYLTYNASQERGPFTFEEYGETRYSAAAPDTRSLNALSPTRFKFVPIKNNSNILVGYKIKLVSDNSKYLIRGNNDDIPDNPNILTLGAENDGTIFAFHDHGCNQIKLGALKQDVDANSISETDLQYPGLPFMKDTPGTTGSSKLDFIQQYLDIFSPNGSAWAATPYSFPPGTLWTYGCRYQGFQRPKFQSATWHKDFGSMYNYGITGDPSSQACNENPTRLNDALEYAWGVSIVSS